MPEDDTINNEETYGIYKNPLRSYLLLLFAISVIAFGVYWLVPCFKWLLIPSIVVMVVSLGFGLPGWQEWEERQRRARKAKKDEKEKWGFHSREREGPWINYIDYPLVKKTKYASGKDGPYSFYSEWLIIQDGYIMVNPGKSTINPGKKTITYDFTDQRGYAWDGCTPKKWFYWLAIIGTPDWLQKVEEIKAVVIPDDKSKEKGTNVRSNDDYKLKGKKVFWQKALHASLIHDVLYQYLDTIPISKSDVDKLFYKMLRESGVWWFIAWTYYFGVSVFAAWGLQKGDRKERSDFTVENFPEIKPEE